MSIIKHVTLQKIVAHDFRYDPRTMFLYAKPFASPHSTFFPLFWLPCDQTRILKGKNNPYIGLGEVLGLQEFEAPRTSRQSAQECEKSAGLTHSQLHPEEISMAFIHVRR